MKTIQMFIIKKRSHIIVILYFLYIIFKKNYFVIIQIF